jgi:hypothetical protein
MMRAAIGLLGLGLLGGLAPTGLRGIPYAVPVVVGAVSALVLLLSGGVAFASFTPRRVRWIARRRAPASTTSRRALKRVTSASPSRIA